jgi:hypothetical protein
MFRCWSCKAKLPNDDISICKKCLDMKKVFDYCWGFFGELGRVARRVQWGIDANESIVYEGPDFNDNCGTRVVDLLCELCDTPIRMADINITLHREYVPGKPFKVRCYSDEKTKPCVNIRRYPKLYKEQAVAVWPDGGINMSPVRQYWD